MPRRGPGQRADDRREQRGYRLRIGRKVFPQEERRGQARRILARVDRVLRGLACQGSPFGRFAWSDTLP